MQWVALATLIKSLHMCDKGSSTEGVVHGFIGEWKVLMLDGNNNYVTKVVVNHWASLGNNNGNILVRFGKEWPLTGKW